MPRISKIGNMKVATGKVWDGETELNNLDGFVRYSTANVDDYKVQLGGMNALDLQKHATQVGEIPRDNRETLINNLIKRFQERAF